MKIQQFVRGIVLSSLGLAACLAAAAPATDRHVIVISLDGVPATLFWNPKVSVPTLRRLAAQGVASEGLVVTNPTTTWSNHTTLVTGVGANLHGVLTNGRFIRGKNGEPTRTEAQATRAEMVTGETVYDHVHRAGFRTAAINWPATLGAETLDDNFPDVPSGWRDLTPRLRDELIALKVLDDPEARHFRTGTAAARDQIWLDAACHVLRTRKPALLYLHLLNTDGTNHRYGADSYAAQNAVALADQYVAALLRTLAAEGLVDRTTIFVVSDHGFIMPEKMLRPNVILRKAGWLETAGPGIARARASVYGSGVGFVFIDPAEPRDAARAELTALFEAHPGVEKVLSPEEFISLGFPSPDKHPGMADLVIVPAEGYGISQLAVGEEDEEIVSGRQGDRPGSHGFLASRKGMLGLFIAAGAGIKAKGRIGLVENRDLAPTVAHLFGLELPGAEGRVLHDILREPVPPLAKD